MPSPLVSVILTSYNRPRYLPMAIDSILNQTLCDIEIIIIDDDSPTPDTDRIGQEYAKKDKRVRYFRQKNTGVGGARNAGVAQAKSDIIAFADDDDIYEPHRLSEQYKLLMQHPEVSAVTCKMVIIDENGKEIAKKKKHNKNKAKPCLAIEAIMIRRSAFNAVNGYRLWFKSRGDYDFAIRLQEKNYLTLRLKKTLVRYRRHNKQLSGTIESWHYHIAVIYSAYCRRCGGDDPVEQNLPLENVLMLLGKIPANNKKSPSKQALKIACKFSKSLIKTESIKLWVRFLLKCTEFLVLKIPHT